MLMKILLNFLYKKAFEYLSSFFLVLHPAFWSPSGSSDGLFQPSPRKVAGDVAENNKCHQISLGGRWCWCWCPFHLSSGVHLAFFSYSFLIPACSLPPSLL